MCYEVGSSGRLARRVMLGPHRLRGALCLSLAMLLVMCSADAAPLEASNCPLATQEGGDPKPWHILQAGPPRTASTFQFQLVGLPAPSIHSHTHTRTPAHTHTHTHTHVSHTHTYTHTHTHAQVCGCMILHLHESGNEEALANLKCVYTLRDRVQFNASAPMVMKVQPLLHTHTAHIPQPNPQHNTTHPDAR